MDTLYIFMGALCLAEDICLFTEKDFLMSVGSAKKEDHGPDKVFQMKKQIFPVDVVCSLGMGMNRFSDAAEDILLVVFGVTLAAHVYVFKSRKPRKENE